MKKYEKLREDLAEAAEAMTEELKRRGYDVFNYCEMD